ncbi:hypothetical protein D3C78_1906230 [compost metagenome]
MDQIVDEAARCVSRDVVPLIQLLLFLLRFPKRLGLPSICSRLLLDCGNLVGRKLDAFEVVFALLARLFAKVGQRLLLQI